MAHQDLFFGLEAQKNSGKADFGTDSFIFDTFRQDDSGYKDTSILTFVRLVDLKSSHLIFVLEASLQAILLPDT